MAQSSLDANLAVLRKLGDHAEILNDPMTINEMAEGLTDVGKTTVQVIGLNRPDLVEARLERINQLKTLLFIIQISEMAVCPPLTTQQAEKARRELDLAVLPEAKFSAMAIDFLSG